MENKAKKTVAVIGAGLSGLSCAYRLSKAGFDVKVFEKDAQVGGRTLTIYKGDYFFNAGAQCSISNYRSYNSLCNEIGIGHLISGFPVDLIINYKGTDCKFFNGNRAEQSNLKFFRSLPFLTPLLRIRVGLVMKILLWIAKRKFDEDNFYNIIKPEHPWNYKVADDVLSKWLSRKEIDEIINTVYEGLFTLHTKHMTMTQFMEQLNGLTHKNVLTFLPKGELYACEVLASKLDVALESPVISVERLGKKAILSVGGRTLHFDYAVIATQAHAAYGMYVNPAVLQSSVLENVRYAEGIAVGFVAPLKVFNNCRFATFPPSSCSVIKGISCLQDFVTLKKERIEGGEKGVVSFMLVPGITQSLWNVPDEEIFSLVAKEVVSCFPAVKGHLENFVLGKWARSLPYYNEKSYVRNKNYWESIPKDLSVYITGDYFAPLMEGSVRTGLRTADLIIENSK